MSEIRVSGSGRSGLTAEERGMLTDFNNLQFEGRRLFAEVFGTFLLVVVGAGGGIVDSISHGAIGRGALVTAPGLTVACIILFMGAVSGAHLNPVVTIAFAFRTDFQWRRVPGYIIAQLIGATLASVVLLAIFGRHGDNGATIPGAQFNDGQAMLIEMLLTLGLVSTVLGAASGAQNVGNFSALAAGSYVILAGLWAGPASGASMNPARSFAPDLIRGDFSHFWIYLVGPVIGALIAVGVAYVLRGPGGDPGGRKAAQGNLS